MLPKAVCRRIVHARNVTEPPVTGGHTLIAPRHAASDLVATTPVWGYARQLRRSSHSVRQAHSVDLTETAAVRPRGGIQPST